MIQKSLLLVAALAGVSLTGTAFAYSPKDAAKTPAPRVIPSSVVKPSGLPLHFAGEVINVEFSLDQKGQPRDIQVLWVSDAALKKQLVEAFRQWRFESAAGAKTDSAKRFILPIQLNPEV